MVRWTSQFELIQIMVTRHVIRHVTHHVTCSRLSWMRWCGGWQRRRRRTDSCTATRPHCRPLSTASRVRCVSLWWPSQVL